MSISTVKDALNIANPVDLPARLYQLWDPTNELGFGDIIDALRPRAPRVRSSLTNQAAHVHDVAARIITVYVTAGTPLAIIHGAAPGAGEVQIEYNATTGVPTLTFAAATTTYAVDEIGPLPQNMLAVMARSV